MSYHAAYGGHDIDDCGWLVVSSNAKARGLVDQHTHAEGSHQSKGQSQRKTQRHQ